MQNDAQVVNDSSLEQSSLIAADPAFATWFQDVDIFVCSRSELVDGMRRASAPALRQMLLSVLQLRESIGLATGRPFV